MYLWEFILSLAFYISLFSGIKHTINFTFILVFHTHIQSIKFKDALEIYAQALLNSRIDEFFKAHPYAIERSRLSIRPRSWLLLSRKTHSTARLHPCARISENGKIRRESEESLYFLVGPSVRGSCGSFLESLSFRVFSFFFGGPTGPVFPVIPSRKRRAIIEGAKGGRERFSRAQKRKKRGRRERGRPSRCLPFIKLLLNAAFLRTHN